MVTERNRAMDVRGKTDIYSGRERIKGTGMWEIKKEGREDL